MSTSSYAARNNSGMAASDDPGRVARRPPARPHLAHFPELLQPISSDRPDRPFFPIPPDPRPCVADSGSMKAILRAAWPFLILLAAPSVAPAQEPAPKTNAGAFWVRLEYLQWWVRNDRAPLPLVTTGPAGVANAGALGGSDTTVLFGEQLDYRANSGGKFYVGGWLDSAQTVGVEATGFCLETHTIAGKVNSDRTDGSPVIA